jgi:transposase
MVGMELDASVLEGVPRRRRSAAERRRVVEETLEPGASVARVARKYGVNANQVFQWRRLYRAGRLGGPASEMKLLPVAVVEQKQPPTRDELAAQTSGGAIHIELPGRAVISLEGSVDPSLVRAVLDCLRG